MKSYTDIEQSKRLAEFLPLESADMCYKCIGEDPYDVILRPYSEWKEEYKGLLVGKEVDVIPCWSLAALLALIPTDDKKDEYYVDTESHSDYHTVSYRNCWDGCIHSEYSEESLLDAAFEMVCWLKENKKI